MALVAERIQQFERLRRRIVFAGHGGWNPEDDFVFIPQGITLAFYVPEASYTAVDAGRLIGRGDPIQPYEVKVAGDRVANYRLYPLDGINLANHPNFDPNFIVSDDPNGILLYDLLHGARIVAADCHWAACRAFMPVANPDRQRAAEAPF